MKSFDEVVNDKEPLNEGLYDKWKGKIDGDYSTDAMLLDIMRKLDSIQIRIENIPGPRSPRFQ